MLPINGRFQVGKKSPTIQYLYPRFQLSNVASIRSLVWSAGGSAVQGELTLSLVCVSLCVCVCVFVLVCVFRPFLILHFLFLHVSSHLNLTASIQLKAGSFADNTCRECTPTLPCTSTGSLRHSTETFSNWGCSRRILGMVLQGFFCGTFTNIAM